MKSFVEQSERHYVSVPRHHLWSRIYIILRVFVSHIYVVYVRVCMYISMCLRVCGSCVCVSVYYDTLVSSLLFSHSHFSTLAFFHSFLSFIVLLLLPFHASLAPCSIYARTRSFPFAFLSLSIFLLSDIPRALSSLSLSRCINIQFLYLHEIVLDSKEGNRAKSNENCDRFSFDFASCW